MEQEIKFEKALTDLEKIVESLESGDLSLEDALKKYEEGVHLARLCTQKLAQAENKIEMLTQSLSGKTASAPIEKELPAEGMKKKSRKNPKNISESGEDLLL